MLQAASSEIPCFPEFLPVITPVQATGLSGGNTERSEPETLALQPVHVQPVHVRQQPLVKQRLQNVPGGTIQAKHEDLHCGKIPSGAALSNSVHPTLNPHPIQGAHI